MFEKNKIAAAVLAVTATSAQAVYLSPDQTGEVLIYPFYNVNSDYVTNIAVANTTDDYKIIKIRLRESGDSQDVLDFNVYMSPLDYWAATVFNSDDNVAHLITADESCTMPPRTALVTVETDTGSRTGTLATGIPMNTAYPETNDGNARLGYVEVIEMASFQSNASWDSIDFADGIKHNANGIPADCGVVVDAWVENSDGDSNDGEWGWVINSGFNTNYLSGAGNSLLDAPTGGLYGYAIYLEMDTGAAYVADAVALDDYSDVAQHYRPDDPDNFLLPSLASGSVRNSVILGGNGTATFANNWPLAWDATYVDGDRFTPASGGNIYPISHVLSTTSVMNDYFIDSTFDGNTDWVITLPMKKHGAPSSDPQIVTFWVDREEGVEGGCDPEVEACFGVSPVVGDPPSTYLDNEVTVIQWGNESVLGASADDALYDLTVNATDFPSGWGKIAFTSNYANIGSPVYTPENDYGTLTDVTFALEAGATGFVSTTGTDVLTGLPAIGFAAIRGNTGGDPRSPADATFGETIPHKTEAGSLNGVRGFAGSSYTCSSASARCR